MSKKRSEVVDHVDVWADGSIRGNPSGEGGLGILIESKRKGIVKAIGIYVPAKEENTNNRMELSAVIESLKILKDQPLVIHLYLDSMYVIGGIKAGGYISNKDLWDKFSGVHKSRLFYINPIHVKGHNGVKRNIVVDTLANIARSGKKDVEFVGHSEEIINKFS